MTELDVFFQGWAEHHQKLVDRLRDLTPEQVLLRTAPDMWAVWQLAAHVAGTRAFWMHDVLGEGAAATRDMFRVTTPTVPGLPIEDAGWEDDENRPRTPDELIDGLTRSWEIVQDCTARWTPEDLLVEKPRRYPSGTKMSSRGWVLWRLLSHDVHHTGEISQILGAHGVGGFDF